MCGQNSSSHLNSVVKPVCLPIFCCRIFIIFAIWGPKSWFKAVCDQKSFILCWYRTRITLNNRVMWTVSDLSMLVSIASRFPPGPLEAEWPVFASTRIYTERLHARLSRTTCTWRDYLSQCIREMIFANPIRYTNVYERGFLRTLYTYTSVVLAFPS